MRLKKITMHHIGPFLSNQSIEFSTTAPNIVMAKNGSGKTTILNALTVMFRDLSIDQLSDEDLIQYNNLINSLVNKNYSDDFWIEVEFQFKEKSWKLKKEFVFVDDKDDSVFSEKVDIYKDEELLKTSKKLDALKTLSEELSKKEKLIFFDGEKIISENSTRYKVGNLLKNIIWQENQIWKIDKAINAIKEVAKNADNFSTEEVEFLQLGKIISDNADVLDNTKQHRTQMQKRVALMNNKINSEVKQLKDSGLTEEDITKLQDNVVVTQHKDFIENAGPLFLAEQKLNDLRIKMFDAHITDLETIKETVAQSKHDENIALPPLTFNADIYFEIMKIANQENHEQLQTLKEEWKSQSEIQQISTKLANPVIKEIVNNFINAKKEYTENLKTINDVDKKIQSLEEEILRIEKEQTHLRRQNAANSLVFANIEKCETTILNLEKLKQQIILSSISDKRTSVLEIYNQLLRKKGWIKSIDFSEKKFIASFITETGAKINYENLSSGEKQLFIFSILQTIKNRSDLPMLVDTPLGRLDNDNKLNILNNVYLENSKQSIIFATDSEITTEMMDAIIQPHNNIYVDFNNKTNSSEVTYEPKN